MIRNLLRISVAVICLMVTFAACNTVEVKETESGAMIYVHAGLDSHPNALKAIVCHPKQVQRQGAGGYDLFVHVKRLEGDKCAWVTFRCPPNNSESSEVRICVGDPPTNTGCNTVSGGPISVEVTSTFK